MNEGLSLSVKVYLALKNQIGDKHFFFFKSFIVMLLLYLWVLEQYSV